ncbi:MAG: hypothetical protein U9Q38_01585 [Thermodesulfobacteriota bacterium]|nr:hypothetical protein [Thermodesulfobacteriota bacterium]
MDIFSGDFSALIFKGSIKSDIGEFSLDSRMLKVLMNLDGKKDLASVHRSLNMNMETLKDVLTRLYTLGLIVKVEKTTPILDNIFFDFLQSHLSLAMGPIAELLIEDEIIELSDESKTIPRHRAAELVDLLARQIPRKEKRIVFQEAMLKKIKEIQT